MDASELSRWRNGAMGLLLLALAVALTAQSAKAQAASGSGTATLRFAQQKADRSLNGQGVKVVAESPATSANRALSLPISSINPAAPASAETAGRLRFKRGAQGVALTKLRFDLTAGTLVGKLGGRELAVFKLGGSADLNSSAGTASLSGRKLRLTAAAAGELRRRLELEHAPLRKGGGKIWLTAKADPIREPARAVVSGAAAWGVFADWREYVLGFFGPGSVGSILTAGGASANGNLSSPGSFFGFPTASGSYERGLYGASDKLVLTTTGSVRFAKPGHCIIEVAMAEVRLILDGANSGIVLDANHDIDKPEGMTCGDLPAVPSPDVRFANLNLTGITPVRSADGKTVTWSAIPATLTAAGAAAFGAGYPEGQALDPVTVTVGLG